MSYGWFGDAWPSGICEDPDARQAPTPVGQQCNYCRELIQQGESGVIYWDGTATHRECAFRSVVGSVAHLEKRCSCFVPGSAENDEEGLSLREGAQATWDWSQEHK